jgi:hypothetical protein
MIWNCREPRFQPRSFVISIIGLTLLTGCSAADVSLPDAADTRTLAPATDSPVPSNTSTVLPTPTPTPKLFSAPVSTPQPTPSITPTPIPPGFGTVPDVIGMAYLQARDELRTAGFTNLVQDVLDLEQAQGIVLDQDPPPGSVVQHGSIVMLFRTFQALQAYAGGACIPLRLVSPSGRLLFWVELEEGSNYLFKTDFDEGRTTIFNTHMVVLDSFSNTSDGSSHFKPEISGRYVVGIGPYDIDPGKLDDSPSGVNAGCLWITPPEAE